MLEDLLETDSGINILAKIVSEYDQEIPQSQTADNPVAPRGRAAQPSQGRQIKQSNQLSLPHQDDCNTRMDIKYVHQHIEQLQTRTMGVTMNKKSTTTTEPPP